MSKIQLFSPLKEIVEGIHEDILNLGVEMSNLELRIAELEGKVANLEDDMKTVLEKEHSIDL